MFINKFNVVVAGIIVMLSQAVAAQAGTELNPQIDILADKLASVSKADVLQGTETQVYIAIGQNDGVLPGNKFEIVRLGEALKVDNEIIGYEETPVAEVEVTRAREKNSICKVLTKTGIPKKGDKAYQVRKPITSLVVGQFSYNQSFNRLTKSIQEKLVTEMASKGMQVVERDQLERVLKEQKLGYSGLINTHSAQKIGQLLGADGMMLGTINDMGNSITINARLVDMETGKTVKASEVELPKTPLIARLLDVPVEDELVVTSPSKLKQKKAAQTKTTHDFTFVLEQCKKTDTTVTCELLITNNESDTNLTIFARNAGLDPHKSTLYDNYGNGYSPSRVRGNCGKVRGGGCTQKMMQGISIRASVTVDGFAPDATAIAVLDLQCEANRKIWDVQFRDITLTEQ